MTRSQVLWLAGIMILGLVLRLPNLGTEPYWGDEALSADIVAHFSSVSEMVTYISEVEFHPPLYYLMLHYWTAFFGMSELGVRSLSVVFGLASIILIYIFSRRLFESKQAGLLAALVMAILPFQIEFSQEGRPYAIVCFFGLAAALSAWEYVNRRTLGWLVLYFFSSLIGLYTHYSFFLVQAAVASWWLWQVILKKDSRDFIWFFAVHAALAVGYWPWLPSLFYKILLGRYEIFGLERVWFMKRIPDFFERTADKLIWINKGKEINPLIILVKTGFKLVFVIFAFRALRQAAVSGISLRGFRYAAWLTVAVLGLFLLAPFSKEYALIFERHIIFVTAMFSVIMGFIVSQLKAKQTAVALLVFSISLLPFVSEVLANDALVDPYFKMKEVSEHINENYQAGDIVLITDAFFRTDAAHYLKPEIPILSVLPASYFGLDIWNSRQTLGLVENEHQSRAQRPYYEQEAPAKLARLVKLYSPERVWLYGFIKKQDYPVFDWFEDNHWRHAFKAVDEIWYLDLYVKPPGYVPR